MIVPSNGIPHLYGALILYFPVSVPENSIRFFLKSYVEYTEYPDKNCVEVTYREVTNIFSWEIDSLLDVLFSNCDLGAVTNALSALSGSALLDISFTHHEKFPTLIFSGKNMDIIHHLKANISIDPY